MTYEQRVGFLLALTFIGVLMYKSIKLRKWPKERDLLELLILGFGLYGAGTFLWNLYQTIPQKASVLGDTDVLVRTGGAVLICYVSIKAIVEILVREDLPQPIITAQSQGQSGQSSSAASGSAKPPPGSP